MPRAMPPLGGKRLSVHAALENALGGNMKPRIVVVTQSMVDEAVIQEMAPDGFDLRIAKPGGADWKEAMHDAEYLVGFVDMLVKDELYAIAPKLK
ncbi:MAG: hypothetical protein ACK5V0_06000, partial [Alphaproteobacteria bacterium]